MELEENKLKELEERISRIEKFLYIDPSVNVAGDFVDTIVSSSPESIVTHPTKAQQITEKFQEIFKPIP